MLLPYSTVGGFWLLVNVWFPDSTASRSGLLVDEWCVLHKNTAKFAQLYTGECWSKWSWKKDMQVIVSSGGKKGTRCKRKKKEGGKRRRRRKDSVFVLLNWKLWFLCYWWCTTVLLNILCWYPCLQLCMHAYMFLWVCARARTCVHVCVCDFVCRMNMKKNKNSLIHSAHKIKKNSVQ